MKTPTLLTAIVLACGFSAHGGMCGFAYSDWVRTSKARQQIYQKLDNIVLGDFSYDGLQLQHVLEMLGHDAKNRDKEKRGVNLFIASNIVPQESAVMGLPVAPVGGGEADLGATTIRIVPAARGLTLHQALDVIVKVADQPIRYSVEDYGVLFLRGAKTPALHTRWFRIDPNTFNDGLVGVVGLDFGGLPSGVGLAGGWSARPAAPRDASSSSMPLITRGGGINYLTPTSTDVTRFNVLNFFRTAGVPLDPPKSVHYNDRLGLLMVRASLSDLDLIEQAVQVLNPQQLSIDALRAGGTPPPLTGQPTAKPADVGPGTVSSSSLPGTTTPATVSQAASAKGSDAVSGEDKAFHVTPPQLRITVAEDGNVVVSWPKLFSDYVLETSASAAPGGAWSPVTATPIAIGAEFSVKLPAPTGAGFYRLIRPR